MAYCRTDIGGAYKLNADDSWTLLLDFVDHDRWNYWGVDALATDPVDPEGLDLVCIQTLYMPSRNSNIVRIGYWGMVIIAKEFELTYKLR